AIRGATREYAGRADAAASRRASHAESAIVSLLRNASHSPRAARAPALLPPAKPAFASSAMTRTSGYADATNAADPSDDPLSTTMTSKDGAAACAASASRQPGSHGRPLQFRTMTLIRGEDGEGTSHDNSREVTRGAPSSGGCRGEDVSRRGRRGSEHAEV